jgi:hypothetical protein
VSKKFEKGAPLFEDMREGLENLRSRLIDLEAAAHAAAETTDQIPFLPRLPRHARGETKPSWTEEDRRNLGRMQSYVINTANAAETALAEVTVLINDLDQSGTTDDDDGGNDGSDTDGANGTGNTGGGRKSGSGVKASAVTDGVPEAIEPEVTKPYRIPTPTKPAVPPSRSGGIILDLPKP